jgi:hypothetical protein
MKLFDVYHALVNLGEGADRLAPLMIRRQHHAGMVLRDLSLGIENAMAALSESTLKTIARN